MKYLPLVAMLLGIAGCTKTQPPKAVEAPIHNASVEDCGHVYERVLAISFVLNTDPNKSYSQDETEAGIVILDRVFTDSGRKKFFFGYCTNHLNVDQASCMLKADSLEDMDFCDKLFATKKVSK